MRLTVRSNNVGSPHPCTRVKLVAIACRRRGIFMPGRRQRYCGPAPAAGRKSSAALSERGGVGVAERADGVAVLGRHLAQRLERSLDVETGTRQHHHIAVTPSGWTHRLRHSSASVPKMGSWGVSSCAAGAFAELAVPAGDWPWPLSMAASRSWPMRLLPALEKDTPSRPRSLVTVPFVRPRVGEAAVWP